MVVVEGAPEEISTGSEKPSLPTLFQVLRPAQRQHTRGRPAQHAPRRPPPGRRLCPFCSAAGVKSSNVCAGD